MATNPLARFITAYHGDKYTLRLAITRLALSEHHMVLRRIAHAWKPRSEFEQELKRIALRSVPLSIPRYMSGPAARVCKDLVTALGIETQEMRNWQTLLEGREPYDPA
jgi:hypothetical protein